MKSLAGIAAVLILLLTASVYSQEAQFISGYEKDSAGELLGYHSPLTYVNSSLLVRSISADKYIEWETGKVPGQLGSEKITFVWMFGIEAKPETHKFSLYVNNEYILSFDNPKDTTVKKWTIEGKDGAKLVFEGTMVDRHADLMGFCWFTLPVKYLKPGMPSKIKIAGESAGRRTWYMTFRHPISNSIKAFPQEMIIRSKEGNIRPMIVEVVHFPNAEKGKIKTLGKEFDVDLARGFNKFTINVPAVKKRMKEEISLSVNGKKINSSTYEVKPVRKLTVYLLHHSHVDIGYTHVQSEVADMQIKNLKDAIKSIEDSKDFPEGAQMRWNTEVVWPVENFMRKCSPEEIEKLKKAVKKGALEINALYANIQTGLCRPEELMKVLEPSRKLYREFGVKGISAMISDIPGLSWGIVPVLAHYGIKYMQIGQNQGDRIGNSLATWGDKPFYWLSQSGKEKILCFTAGQGYSFFHAGLNYQKLVNPFKEEKLSYYIGELEKENYPYDILPIHYTVGSDNGPVHMDLPAIIKDWNEKYISPKIIISTAGNFHKIFESKYASKIPVVRGDYTGSWDDGAASTARESALNRRSADRLTQAEALYAINGKKASAKEFDEAWENVLLFSEHTWGSWNSMSDPENPFTKQQWEVKKSFALKADSLAGALIDKAVYSDKKENVLDVYNTSSYKRSGWVRLQPGINTAGLLLLDGSGNPAKFQILKDGSVSFYAADVPALGVKRFFIQRGINDFTVGSGREGIIENDRIILKIDPNSGNIAHLEERLIKHNFAEGDKGLAGYQYVSGRDPKNYSTDSNIRILKGEEGPFIKSVKVISDAPGCNSLEREYYLYGGESAVGIRIKMDRKKVYDPEGIHIAFPFNIADAKPLFNTAWSNYRPQIEQLEGSCKNYFPIQRFADVSNTSLGITLVPVDAPMIEMGDRRTDGNVYGWIKEIKDSPLIYSYPMNNYWGTNFKAEQEGVTEFFYLLYPHGAQNLPEIERKALDASQPLIAALSAKDNQIPASLFEIDSKDVMATSVKQSADGKGLVVRLYNPSRNKAEVSFKWGAFKPSAIYYTNPDEEEISPANGIINLVPAGIATLKLIR